MAAGNAESVTNGVTGVGSNKVLAHAFRDSNVDGEVHTFWSFRPLSPVAPLALRSRLPFLVLGFQHRFEDAVLHLQMPYTKSVN